MSFDPGLRLGIHFARIAVDGGNRRTDDHANHAGLFDEAAPRPVVTRVMCHRHDELAIGGREHGATDAVLARFAWRHARALGKENDPLALGQPRFALLEYVAYGGRSATTVDRNRA